MPLQGYGEPGSRGASATLRPWISELAPGSCAETCIRGEIDVGSERNRQERSSPVEIRIPGHDHTVHADGGRRGPIDSWPRIQT